MRLRRWSLALLVAIAGIAGIGALLIYNWRADSDIKSQMYVPKNSPITPEIELLQRYIRIDTSNPPGRELAGARFLADLLEKHGLRAEIIESAPGRGNVYARLEGKRRGEGLLLFNHIDVVPADPKGWNRPPFAAAIAVNQLWGRGSLDMKSIAMCELEGLFEVAKRGKPERDIVFLGVADEEQGGALGTQWLLQHRPDIFEGVKYALNEGGITETRQEQLSYFGIEIGTKMAVNVRLRAPSREVMQRVRLALEPYLSPRDPDHILPEVREFFRDLAPLRVEHRKLLEDVDRTVATGKFWLLARGYKELTQNIVFPQNIKTDAQGATMDVNLYNLPDENPDRRIAWLQSQVRPFGATIEAVLSKNGPAPLTSRHTPLFALIESEVHQQYGPVRVGTEILAAWSNDSRFLRAHGVQCYGMWPFPVDFYQTQGIHSTNERIRLDWYMQGVALMRRLIPAYAMGPAS
ncbi:MAG TPA: M20/M25/M40 family metallo-hydrolase [Thermoanaerobaculia bacterium]|jgi:acetylornithine deacetylase/succinyl-diaminopimelate desuccinylase-like protein